MFRLLCLGLLLAALLVVVAACTAPGGQSWLALLSPQQDKATIALAVGTPIRLNQAVPITITVHANTDIWQMDVELLSSVPHALIQGDHSWQVGDVPAGRTLQLTSSVVFPREAEYQLVAGVHNIEGMFYSTAQTIDVTAQGGVVLPPVTAQPGNLLGTPRPAPTRAPIPPHGTPWPATQPPPAATVTP